MSVASIADPAAEAPPALRLLPVPVCEPPYDDELPVPPPVAARLPPLRALLARPLRLVPPPAPPTTPAPASPVGRPAVHAFAQAIVQGLLEVQAGVRPLQQLQSATSPELYEQLEQVIRVGRRAPGVRPGSGAVRSLHIQQRGNSAAEICVRVERGQRQTALALRIEAVGTRWRATQLVGL